MPSMDKDCSNVCRICLSGETSLPSSGTSVGEPLISPCRCKGTMGLYHRGCLETWLSHSKNLTCEICKYEYRVKRPGFYDYLKSRRLFEQAEQGILALEYDILIIVLGFLLACYLVYLCYKMAKDSIFIDRDIEQQYAYETENHLVKWIVLVLFVVLVIWTYIYRIISTYVFHKEHFLKWQLHQRNSDFTEYVLNQSTSPLLRISVSSIFVNLFQRPRVQPALRDTAIDVNPELIETARQGQPNFGSFRSFRSSSSISGDASRNAEPLVLSTFRRSNAQWMVPLHHSTPAAVIDETSTYEEPDVFYQVSLSPVMGNDEEASIRMSPAMGRSYRYADSEITIRNI